MNNKTSEKRKRKTNEEQRKKGRARPLKQKERERERRAPAALAAAALPPSLLFPPSFYFHSFRKDMLLSPSLRMTLGTAISKSSWVTWTRRSLRANIPMESFSMDNGRK